MVKINSTPGRWAQNKKGVWSGFGNRHLCLWFQSGAAHPCAAWTDRSEGATCRHWQPAIYPWQNGQSL